MNQTFRSFLMIAAASLAFSSVTTVSAEIPDADFSKAMDKYLASQEGQKALGSTIESYFQNRQKESAKRQEEQAAADIENQFKNPVSVAPGASPVRGPADAKITIIEFSDFQCPFCKRGKDTMEAVMKKYPTQVKVAFKNLPLPFHEQALPAAKAALAAGKQGKFWEMHDLLFDNQAKLGDAGFLEFAKTLNLNIDQFKKDMASADVAKQIKEDKDLGEKLGIQGTPGFFVNGVAVRGAYPIEHFSKIIDRWLAQAK